MHNYNRHLSNLIPINPSNLFETVELHRYGLLGGTAAGGNSMYMYRQTNGNLGRRMEVVRWQLHICGQWNGFCRIHIPSSIQLRFLPTRLLCALWTLDVVSSSRISSLNLWTSTCSDGQETTIRNGLFYPKNHSTSLAIHPFITSQ